MISKFAPKRQKYLINKSEIKEQLVKIDNTDDYYITPSGKVYRKYIDKYYPRKTYTSKQNGYIYITLVESDGQAKTHRLHRLVAKAYIPNPNHYSIVGHKDNIKTNCHMNNLYWTTNKENIQKAVNDGLLINDKGYNDSQSIPVIAYDQNFNEIGRFGKTKTRTGYYFRFQDT